MLDSNTPAGFTETLGLGQAADHGIPPKPAVGLQGTPGETRSGMLHPAAPRCSRGKCPTRPLSSHVQRTTQRDGSPLPDSHGVAGSPGPCCLTWSRECGGARRPWGMGSGVWQWDWQFVAEGARGRGDGEAAGLGSLRFPTLLLAPTPEAAVPPGAPNLHPSPHSYWRMTHGNNFPPTQGQITADNIGGNPPDLRRL